MKQRIGLDFEKLPKDRIVFLDLVGTTEERAERLAKIVSETGTHKVHYFLAGYDWARFQLSRDIFVLQSHLEMTYTEAYQLAVVLRSLRIENPNIEFLPLRDMIDPQTGEVRVTAELHLSLEEYFLATWELIGDLSLSTAKRRELQKKRKKYPELMLEEQTPNSQETFISPLVESLHRELPDWQGEIKMGSYPNFGFGSEYLGGVKPLVDSARALLNGASVISQISLIRQGFDDIYQTLLQNLDEDVRFVNFILSRPSDALYVIEGMEDSTVGFLDVNYIDLQRPIMNLLSKLLADGVGLDAVSDEECLATHMKGWILGHLQLRQIRESLTEFTDQIFDELCEKFGGIIKLAEIRNFEDLIDDLCDQLAAQLLEQ